MLADPCNAQLYQGIYGTSEGSIDRARSTVNIAAGEAQGHASGYILWLPDYDNDGGRVNNEVHGNVFIWMTNQSSQQPQNAGGADPRFTYGGVQYDSSAAPYESAYTVRDPMHQFLNSGVAADSRTVAACVALTYTGAMQDASGEVCYIEDMSATTLLYGGDNGGPVSVDDLFTAAPVQHRLGVDKLELKFRPSDASEHFRNSTTSPVMHGNDGAGNITASYLSENAKSTDPSVFGIAWRGMNPDAALSLVLTKVAEWRPQASLGLVKPPPRALKTRSMVQPALAVLDAKKPHWTKTVTNLLGQGAKWLARTAFTGVGTYFGGAAGGKIGNDLGRLIIQ